MFLNKNSYKKIDKAYRTLKNKTPLVLWAIVRSIFIIGFSFIILHPVINMISKAFMHQVDVNDNTVLWFPKNFTLENLKFAWKLMNYPAAFLNSSVVTVITTLLQTTSCLIIGYGFARFEFKFKKILFALVMITILVPPQQVMAPLYLYFKNFDVLGIIKFTTGKSGINMLDSYWPFLFLSATGFGIRNGLFIFIFRQFFRSMPTETEEAAWVDGVGPLRTFAFIMVPNATTVIITVILFSFVWQWNDVFYSGIFLQNLRMLPQAFQLYNSYIGGNKLISIVAEEMTRYNLYDFKVLALLRNAAIFMIMAPVVMIYTFMQRYFVEGIERSGIVG